MLRRVFCVIALLVACTPAFAQTPPAAPSDDAILSRADDALVRALGDFANGCQTTLARYMQEPVPPGSPDTCPDTPLTLAELRYIVELGRMDGVLRGCGSELWRNYFGALDLKLRARPDLTDSQRYYGAFVHGSAQGMTRSETAPAICGEPPSAEGRRRAEEWAMRYFTYEVLPLAWPTSREDYLRAGVPPELLR